MSDREVLDAIVERVSELRLLRAQINPQDWGYQTGRILLKLLAVVFQLNELEACNIMSKLVGEIWMSHEGIDEASEKHFNEAVHRMFEAERQDRAAQGN